MLGEAPDMELVNGEGTADLEFVSLDCVYWDEEDRLFRDRASHLRH